MNKPDSQTSKPATGRSASKVVTSFTSKRRDPARKDSTPDKQQRERTARQVRQDQSAAAVIPRLTLKQLRDAIDQVPDINATRVVQLHQRIMASEYKIDLERLTDKLLALESELTGDR